MSKKTTKPLDGSDAFYCETFDLDFRLLDKFFTKGGDKLSEAKSELFKDIERATEDYKKEIEQRIETFERTYGVTVSHIYKQRLGIGDECFYGVVVYDNPRKRRKGGH